MSTYEAAHLLREARGGSTAAPLELFMRIRAELRASPSPPPGTPARSRIEAAYEALVPAARRSEAYHASFLSIGAAALRDVLAQPGRIQPQRSAPARRPAVSFQTLGRALAAGTALQARHRAALSRLDAALDRLGHRPGRVAEIVEGRLFAQMTDRELALALGLSEEAVRTQAARGRQWLRRAGTSRRSTTARRRPPGLQQR